MGSQGERVLACMGYIGIVLQDRVGFLRFSILK